MSSTGFKIHLKCVAKDANGKILQVTEKEDDVATDNLGNLFAAAIFAGSLATFKGKTTAGVAGTAFDLPVASFAIMAGTGLTAAAQTDFAIQTPIAGASGSAQSVLLNGSVIITGGSFTITGFFQNETVSPIVYGNVGVVATDTTPSLFLLTHDQTNGATGISVPANGTLDASYTITYA